MAKRSDDSQAALAQSRSPAQSGRGGTRWLEPLPPIDAPRPPTLAEAVRNGLCSPDKSLPSWLFYDAEGSKLFEQICDLPEYYLTRAETEILDASATDLATRLPQIETVVELGSGSAVKTELLLRAFEQDRELRYAPIDVSHSALEESIARIEQRHPELEILATQADYEAGLAALASPELGPTLVLWLGSSIGNLPRNEAARFLARRSAVMEPEDRLLIGIDLRKDRETLERAYDDSEGVTARFDLNLLERINRELGADFAMDAFAHRVHYHETSGSVQSFIESQRTQRVAIDALEIEVAFEHGERIHTEDSYKYSFQEIDALAQAADLELCHRYLDDAERFSLNLFKAVSPA